MDNNINKNKELDMDSNSSKNNNNNQSQQLDIDNNSSSCSNNNNSHSNNQHKVLNKFKNHYPNSYDVSQSYGGLENLLMAFGQKPFNSQDYEAQGCLQAFKQDSCYYEDSQDNEDNQHH